jgi:hypothetical protein
MNQQYFKNFWSRDSSIFVTSEDFDARYDVYDLGRGIRSRGILEKAFPLLKQELGREKWLDYGQRYSLHAASEHINLNLLPIGLTQWLKNEQGLEGDLIGLAEFEEATYALHFKGNCDCGVSLQEIAENPHSLLSACEHLVIHRQRSLVSSRYQNKGVTIEVEKPVIELLQTLKVPRSLESLVNSLHWDEHKLRQALLGSHHWVNIMR